MSWPSEHYHELAIEARERAATSTLPQVKLQYLRSAEHFDEIVATLEGVAQAKIRNEAARKSGLLEALQHRSRRRPTQTPNSN